MPRLDRLRPPCCHYRPASETGEPLNRHNFTRRSFKPLLKQAGVPEVVEADLRHTCATLLLTRNVNPKIVSEVSGMRA